MEIDPDTNLKEDSDGVCASQNFDPSNARFVHRVRFLKHQVYPVRQLSWDAASARLAVGRSEGSIEVWKFRADPFRPLHETCWYMERRIPGSIGRKVEGLAWCNGKLFATGASGVLIEFDSSFNIVREIPALAGGVSCIVANQPLSKLALGSHDGSVIIYDVLEQGLVYDRTLERRNEKIVSIAWHEGGKVIVTGCKGHILIWDFATGRVQNHISLAKSVAKRKDKRGKRVEKDILVWAVRLFADMTIVTGDSSGMTSLWDGNMATLKTQFQTHQGDVLAVCSSPDEKAVWSSGVDPRVVEIRRDPAADAGWHLGHINDLAKHDVRALVYIHCPKFPSEAIVFAGDDPRLTMTCVKKLRVDKPTIMLRLNVKKQTNNARLPPAQGGGSSRISVSRQHGVVASLGNREIEIWKLGSSSCSDLSLPGKILPPDSSPVKILNLPTKHDHFFTACALNDDATLLATSDQGRTCLYRLDLPQIRSNSKTNANPPITKIAALTSVLSPGWVLTKFLKTSTGDLLVGVTRDQKLEVLRIFSEGEKMNYQKMTLALSSSGFPSCLSLGVRNFKDQDASFCAVGFTSGHVDIIDVEVSRVITALPALSGIAVTCVTFSPDGSELVAVYANREVAFFAQDSQMTSYWPTVDHNPYLWRSDLKSVKNNVPIDGVLYLSPLKILMFCSKAIYTLDRDVEEKESEGVVAKRARLESPETMFRFSVQNFELVHHVDVLGNGNVLIVESTMNTFESSLPEPLHKKKFGT